jgi:elongation factor Ts
MSELQVSASDVKKLRDQTGAGMMDCKKALAESNGDFEAAIEYLRKRGQKLSLKRADRDAKEGVVYALVSADHKKGIVIRLSCETDFVAKNDDFVALARSFAELALEHFPTDREALLAIPYEHITIGEKINEQVAVVGEKIELADYARLESEMVVSYIHMGYRAGVIVALNKHNTGFVDAGRDVAMQIAAMKPVAVDKNDVDPTVIEKEIEIGKEIARQEGKPEEMLEKIAMGKLNKFYKESTLLNQSFVKDGGKTVAQYLQDQDKELTVVAFKHVQLG